MRLLLSVVLCIACNAVFAQPKTDTLLQNILSANKNDLFLQVLQHPQTYRLQVIYTQVNRDKHNVPSFTNYYFNYDSTLYFNPASTVKLPLALLSLEKLHTMHIKGVNKYTAMQYDSSYEKQETLYNDSTAQNNLPSIAQFIKKVFLISDNDAYNRMYQFVGQQTINKKLHDKGYNDIRITRQFMGFTPQQNRHTNAIRFIKEDGSLLYTQPPAYNTDSFYFPRQNKIGEAYYNSNDSLIHAPIDFTMANNISLKDLQQILQSALFPSSVPAAQRFDLGKDDYRFLYRYMSQYPSETSYPKYDTATYYDSYVKFFFKQGSHTVPEHVRVFNKVGWAYGFLTDVSYVADFKNNIEFMLSATVYVNSDGILNDDKYDYDSIGYPFMYQLGQTIYQYELQRHRDHAPKLSAFSIKYDHRSVNDIRPSIHDADN